MGQDQLSFAFSLLGAQKTVLGVILIGIYLVVAWTSISGDRNGDMFVNCEIQTCAATMRHLSQAG